VRELALAYCTEHAQLWVERALLYAASLALGALFAHRGHALIGGGMVGAAVARPLL